MSRVRDPSGRSDCAVDAVAELARANQIAEALEGAHMLAAEVLNPKPGDTVVVTIDRDVHRMSDFQRKDMIERFKAIWPDQRIAIVARGISVSVERDPLSVRCPMCDEDPGEPCRAVFRGQILEEPHGSRRRAARGPSLDTPLTDDSSWPSEGEQS